LAGRTEVLLTLEHSLNLKNEAAFITGSTPRIELATVPTRTKVSAAE